MAAPQTGAATLPDAFVAFAHRLADAAGAVIRPYFRQPIAVDDKPDRSPVTIADREAEQAMRAVIEATYPEHGILGEEMGGHRTDAEYVWLLDPIDGTKSFITGSPMFGTLIALVHRDRPVLGVIDQPVIGERWLGAAGRTSTLNGAPIRVRPCPDVADAAMYTWGGECFEGQDGAAFRRLGERVKYRRFSGDCYAYGLLAMGFVDLVVENTMSPWDYAALVPVIEGAGGRITDWAGRPLGLQSDGTVLASGDAGLHTVAIDLLRG